MSTFKYPDYPPALNTEQRNYLLTTLKDWSIAHGLAVRPAPTFVDPKEDPSGVLATPAPVTLFPSLFPRSCFEEALSIQTAYNELYAAISQDEDWLEGIVTELLDIDDFVARLWKVHLAVKKEGYAQRLALGLFRSDYMVHVDEEAADKRLQIKQVEFNTISSSFGGLSWKVSALHKHLSIVDAYPELAVKLDGNLPDSRAVPALAAGLAAGHKAYGTGIKYSRTCVIFVVQDPERNVFDQRHLEYELLATHCVRSFRVPFHKILDYTSVSEGRELIYRPPQDPERPWEVSTIYTRAGYSPDEYTSERDWDARLHLERSKAIKCPSILTHLAGCKKVQQVLATPHSSHLSRFVSDADKAARLLQTFAPIYPLDESAAGEEARGLATDPDSAARYVLKPQREGGGNNVYRRKIPAFLETLPRKHWPAWILMEMIEPPALRNAIVRNGEVQEGGVIGELGVFGVCLWRHAEEPGASGEVLENWEAGYLLRSKGDQSEEGGVAAGFGAVASCCLIDV